MSEDRSEGRAEQPAQPPASGAMTPTGIPPTASPPTAAPSRPAEPWITRGELRFAGVLLLASAVLGAVLGVCWHLWSHTATLGELLGGHTFIPDETEGFISSDGRFAVLTGVVGLLLGGFAWTRRPQRGPATAAALAVSGFVGAVICDLVGRLLGGGRDTGAAGTIVDRLPLQVHAQVFLLVWAVAALVVYLICALFAESDDLGWTVAAPASLATGAVSAPSISTAGPA